MKDCHDFGPSPNIESSGGPEPDLRKFYCTTYSTTHKSWGKIGGVNAAPPPRPKSAAKGKYMPQVIKRKTGYTSNLNSFVEYDPKVDESNFKYAF